MGITRRQAIGCAAATAAGAAGIAICGWPAGQLRAAVADGSTIGETDIMGVKEAEHWRALGANRVKCVLCPRQCSVADMERGYCGVRENRGGKYYTLVYGTPSAVHIDPIEKKPLFHYLPGKTAYSIGTAGCNFECLFCQNWNISQFRPEQVDKLDLPAERVINQAQSAGCGAVAHTYNEPIVFYEYARECARCGREAGMPNVMISNGYIQKAPMQELCKELGAVKIDLKAFSEKFYAETCHGKLQPVLDTLKTLKEEGVWFEIVVLLVTGLNDSGEEVKKLANWVAADLSPDVPLHFSRYFPYYKLQLPPTPVETMQRAYEAAKSEGCHFVYVGNIELPGKADTLCPSCGTVAIKRMGLMVLSNNLKDGKCPKCGRAIPGVWRSEDAWKRGILG